MGQAGRVLSEPSEPRVRTSSGKYPSIAFGEGAPTLALKRTGNDCRPAASSAGANDLIDEVDELVRESNSDLLAHPIMVAKW
jgi:hypothetical protein